MTLQEYIKTLLPYAKNTQDKYGVPVSITIGQAILESWKGDHPSGLATNANNYFGVKAGKSWEGAYYWADTTENINGKDVTVKAKFRKYENAQQSVDDHAHVLQKWNVRGKSAYEIADAITSGKMKYATDPDYKGKLLSIIQKNGLLAYDKNTSLPPWVDEGGNIIINPVPTQPSGGSSPDSSGETVELTDIGQFVRVVVLIVLFIMALIFLGKMVGIGATDVLPQAKAIKAMKGAKA